MPTYGKNDFKQSNTNYLNKDFSSLRQSLMNYAKSYFPNEYKDFNETSPGMMLLEMNAYVGDVLSFYIDQQYREMLLPLAEERRNIVNIASMLGYKVKPIVPSLVDVIFTQTLNASGTDSSKVDYATGGVFGEGVVIKASTPGVTFQTLDVLDFQISSSGDTSNVATTDTDGLATSYNVSRKVKAVSAEVKTKSFVIGAPEKFKNLVINDKNVIDIISCIDSNGNEWYEVDFLAQDKVPISTHYTQDENRQSAYHNALTGEVETNAVPYSLSYIKTSKRFTRETNVDNTTSLIFGNGVLNDGRLVDDNYIDSEQIGITIPGQYGDLNDAIDPLLGDEYSTLGETPNNTTLTITYRVGGGINSNIQANTIDTVSSGTKLAGVGVATNLTVSNPISARGGKNEESIDEIREKAKAFFTTQNRCVTKEDYEARVLNMPSKFGNIAKVYVTRDVTGDTGYSQSGYNSAVSNLTSTMNGIINTGQQNGVVSLTDIQDELQTGMLNTSMDRNSSEFTTLLLRVGQAIGAANTSLSNLLSNEVATLQQTQLSSFELSSINIYVLAFNSQKQLIGNPMITYDNTVSDNVPTILLENIKKYLENFKIITDTIKLSNGYIVNFGVFFDVIAEQYADKQLVNLRCIEKIKEYFNVDKMQFNQPIFKSKLEFELMGVEGVRSVGHITITQQVDYHENGNGESLIEPTYRYSYKTDVGPDLDGDGQPDGGFTVTQNTDYNYRYNFEEALSEDKTIIKPPSISTPTVFELKNPNDNIKGRVR